MDRMFVIKSFARQDDPRVKSAIARERILVLDDGVIDGTYPVGPSYGTKGYTGAEAASAAAEAAIEALRRLHDVNGERTRGFLTPEGMIRAWSQTPREERNKIRAAEVVASGDGYLWVRAATEAERVAQRSELGLANDDPCDFVALRREQGRLIEAVAMISESEIISVRTIAGDPNLAAIEALEAKLQPQMAMSC